MAPHSSTLAWKIPWTEEPGGLQSMGRLRVRHDWATLLSLFTFMHWKRNGNPLQCSCLENPRDGGAWWTAVYGVAQSRTWLKRCSSSSSSMLFTAVQDAWNDFSSLWVFSFEVFDWLQLSFSHWSSAVSGQTCQSSLFWGQICMLYISVTEDFSHSQYLMHVIVLVFSYLCVVHL